MKLNTLLVATALATSSFAATSEPALASVASAPLLADSFESPGVSGGYQYGPFTDDAGARFDNGAGIQANGSAWGFQQAPEGVQTAFIQSYNASYTGSITESLSGLTVGKTYTLLFDDAQRPGYGAESLAVSYLPFEVADPLLTTTTPSSTAWTSQSVNFTAASPNGEIVFQGGNAAGVGQDFDVGLDKVSVSAAVSAAPEPASWALMIVGVGGVGVAFRQAKRRRGLALAQAI